MRALALAVLTLAACQPGKPVATNQASAAGNASGAQGGADAPFSSDDPAPPAAQRPAGPTPDCAVIDSTGWSAHVDAMPGPNANPRLIVSGRVTVPTGGYRVALRMGEVAESYPVQVTVYLDVTPPAEGATQAIVTHDVRGDWPSEERVGSVTVRCASRVLARIDDVETAH